MKHTSIITGEAFALRPLTLEDAPLIVELRTDRQRTKFLHSVSPSLNKQRMWIEGYLRRANDYYFVIERLRESTPEGLIGIYDVALDASGGEWGRWILRSGSIAAVESAYLIYKFAFEILRLKMVYCNTVVGNKSVVSFHDSCGLINRGIQAAHRTLDSGVVDSIRHECTMEYWQTTLAAKLIPQVQWIARRVNNSSRE